MMWLYSMVWAEILTGTMTIVCRRRRDGGWKMEVAVIQSIYWRLSFTMAVFVVYHWQQLLCLIHQKTWDTSKKVEQNAIETIIVHQIYTCKMQYDLFIHGFIISHTNKWRNHKKANKWNGIIQTKALSHPSPPHTHKTPSRPAFLRPCWPIWWMRDIYPPGEPEHYQRKRYKKEPMQGMMNLYHITSADRKKEHI